MFLRDPFLIMENDYVPNYADDTNPYVTNKIQRKRHSD